MSQFMDDSNINRRYRLCMILVLIPMLIFVFWLICLGLAVILEMPTDRGMIYTIFAFLVVLIPFIAPIPCLVLGIIGIVLSAPLSHTGRSTTLIKVLGIIDIVAALLTVAIAIGAVLLAGQM